MKIGKLSTVRSLCMASALCVPFLLAGCSKKPNTAPGNTISSNTSACVGNRYLMKYGCSLQRMQTAAEAGDPDAQYALGYMYYYGINTVRDPRTAKLWIRRAAMQGQPLAKKATFILNNGGSIPRSHGQARSTSYSPPPSHYEPKVDVNKLNSAAPDKSLDNHLPGYGSGQDSAKSNTKSDDEIKPPPLMPDRTNESRNSRIINNEKQVMQASAEQYTLQLMGSHNLAAINSFIQRNGLQSGTKIYRTKFQNRQWYMLIYGDYKNVAAARAAVRRLPRGVRALNPWVKSYGMVQKEVRLQKVLS